MSKVIEQLDLSTTWGKVMGTGERKAYSLNTRVRYRYRGFKFRTQPFKAPEEAKAAIQERASTWVLYG